MADEGAAAPENAAEGEHDIHSMLVSFLRSEMEEGGADPEGNPEGNGARAREQQTVPAKLLRWFEETNMSAVVGSELFDIFGTGAEADALLQEDFRSLTNAAAAGTWTQYFSYVRQFSKFCRRHERRLRESGAPADIARADRLADARVNPGGDNFEAVVGGFLAHCNTESREKNLKSKTENARSALSFTRRVLGGKPFALSGPALRALKSAKREFDREEEQAIRLPVNLPTLMMESKYGGRSKFQGNRMVARAGAALFTGGLRCSDVIDFLDTGASGDDPHEGYGWVLDKRKNRSGRRTRQPMPTQPGHILCSKKLMEDQMSEESMSKGGPFMPAVRKSDRTRGKKRDFSELLVPDGSKRISKKDFADKLYWLWEKCGVPPEDLTVPAQGGSNKRRKARTHSPRVSAATEMHEHTDGGKDILLMLDVGGWTTAEGMMVYPKGRADNLRKAVKAIWFK